MTQDMSRSDVRLDNWRTAPFSRWAFQNVSEIVPSATIRSNRLFEEATYDLGPFSGLPVTGLDGKAQPLETFLEASDTDAFVVMRQGRLVAEWYAGHCDPACPHIIFSVSKSLTALVAGILVGQGKLSLSDLIVKHVPEAEGSAYADATVQQLLDMEISLDFEENYLDPHGAFNRYRRATAWAPDNPADPAPDLKTFLCSLPKGKSEHGRRACLSIAEYGYGRYRAGARVRCAPANAVERPALAAAWRKFGRDDHGRSRRHRACRGRHVRYGAGSGANR